MKSLSCFIRSMSKSKKSMTAIQILKKYLSLYSARYICCRTTISSSFLLYPIFKSMKLTQELLQQMWFHNQNYTTGRYYEWLTNQEKLQAQWYPKPLRMTYHQAKQSGLIVKKWERWTRIVHRTIKEKQTAKWIKKIPCIKKYIVFNIDQCEELKPQVIPSRKKQPAIVSWYTDDIYEIDFQDRQMTRCKKCWCNTGDVRIDDDRPCYCRECAIHWDMVALSP